MAIEVGDLVAKLRADTSDFDRSISHSTNVIEGMARSITALED
jgi:hypothetical protein